MHRGYIKLWRRLQNNDLWTSEKFTRGQAWVDLLLLANYKKNKIRVRGVSITVERGQLAYSELSLAERWGWSRGKVRRFLQEMEHQTVQQIKQQKSNLTTIITILNYDEYQEAVQQTRQDIAQQTVQQTDTKQDSKRYTNNKDKKVNKVKEYKYTSDFLEFWKLYPKKTGKGAAYNSWKKIAKSNSLIKEIMEAVKNQIGCEQWERDSGQYIPNPATWLNQRRWEDEIKPKKKESKTSWREEALKDQ